MSRRQLFMLVPVFLIGTGFASAQIRSGSIVGRVVDTSNLAIPNAQVNVLAEETNAKFETTTDAAGGYLVPYLQPDRYEVTVTQKGFASRKVTGIRVTVAETVRVDLTLEIGSVVTAVEVTAAGTALQTENSAVQNTVTSVIIDRVPNITSNPFYFATLQAGVVGRANISSSQTARAFAIGQEARRQFTEISVNGGDAYTNDLLLDGISIQGPDRHEATVVPNPEGLQEVRTIVNNYSAEYGRGQGVITITTKSGTNDYHGSAFYRLRNEAFNANSFGNNARGVSRPPFKVNQYGGAFGGPIRKDKTFFFVSYEGLKFAQPEDFLGTVPTAREKRGDFSQTLANVSGRPTPLKLFNPFAAVQEGPNLYRHPPIPNSIMPTPNPFIIRMFSFYPSPNRTPQDVYNTNNFFSRGKRTFGRDSVNARVDQYLGKHSLYGSFGVYSGETKGSRTWGEDSFFTGAASSFSGGQGLIVTDDNYYAALGDTFVVSPTLVFDIRYGVGRVNSLDGFPVTENFDYNQFGITGDIQSIMPAAGLPPGSSWGGAWSALQGDTTQKTQYQTTHHVVSSLTKTMNRWAFKFGGEFRAYLSNHARHGVIHVTSSNTYTLELVNAGGQGVGGVTPDIAGNGAASLLLGAGQLSVGGDEGLLAQALVHKYLGFYSQNDWQATNRLKVNLGLRWDIQPGITDRYDTSCGIDLGDNNPFGTAGKWVCAGKDGASRNFWPKHYKDFAPRIGLAYRVKDTFVVRAGYGFTYLAANDGFGNTLFAYGNEPFQTGTINRPYGLQPTGVPVGQFNDPKVNQILRAVGYDPRNPVMYTPTSSTFPRDGSYLDPIVQQWNLFLEKRLSRLTLSAGYSASKANRLLVTRWPIQNSQGLPDSLVASWRQSYIVSNGKNDPGTEQVPNPFQPASGPLLPFPGILGQATITRLAANLPYPLFTSSRLSESIGWSNYHSLVFQVKGSFGDGLMFNTHYTWSKSLSFTTSELNSGFQLNSNADINVGDRFGTRDLRTNYAPSLFDVTHRVVGTLVYELPFGAGKHFSVKNPLLNSLVSGWRTSGTAVFQSGNPIEISGASTGAMNVRPDRVTGVPIEVPKDLQRWYDGKTTVTLPDGRQLTPCNFCFLKYNSDAFRGRVVQTPDGSVVPDVYWIGNAALRYSDFRSPGMSNVNISIDRMFRVRERLSVIFSAQATNAFNLVSFQPTTNRNLGSTNTRATPSLGLVSGMGLSSDFGTYSNGTFDPRQIQFQLKVIF